jgi:SAM-dependent methyltransferase
LKEPIDGGELIECIDCDLYFRWPRTSQAVLDQLYRDGSSTAWADEPESRADWAIAGAWLGRDLAAGSAILDIGCSTGGFLAGALPSDVQKCGIEINSEAAQIATRQGINILGRDIFRYADEQSHHATFSVVIAFDVVEHTRDPLEFLRVCAGLVRPGGRIILGTANTNAKSWSFSGARYWYCAIAEHMSFISDRWCQIAARKLGLDIGRKSYFSHGRRGLLRKTRECLINFLYVASPGIFRRLRILGIGAKDVHSSMELADYPPSWMSAKDHILVEFLKRRSV